MTAKETVQALYAAYATGDPDRIAASLHPDVIWVAPAGNATQIALGLGSADDAGPPRGLNDLDRDAIVAFMAHDYPRFFADVTFEPRSMVGEGNVVLAEHRMSATLPNGRPYVNDYCSPTRSPTAGLRRFASTWTRAAAGCRSSAAIARRSC